MENARNHMFANKFSLNLYQQRRKLVKYPWEGDIWTHIGAILALNLSNRLLQQEL